MGKHKSDDYKLQAIKHYLKNGNYVKYLTVKEHH